MKFVLSTSMIVQLVIFFLLGIISTVSLILTIETYLQKTFRLHEWYQWGYVWLTVLLLQFIMSFVMYHEIMWKVQHKLQNKDEQNTDILSNIYSYASQNPLY